jgi:hypothetical protein
MHCFKIQKKETETLEFVKYDTGESRQNTTNTRILTFKQERGEKNIL